MAFIVGSFPSGEASGDPGLSLALATSRGPNDAVSGMTGGGMKAPGQGERGEAHAEPGQLERYERLELTYPLDGGRVVIASVPLTEG